MMKFRELTEEDYKESMGLSSYAFQYTISDEDIPKVKERIQDHHLVGFWDEERLAAKLHIIPLSVMINQEPWKMGGIAGVATYPEYRRMGLVKQLIAYSLKRMKDEDQIVSLLHPFNIAFYRKYGWEIFTDNKKIEIENSQLKMIQPIKGHIKRFTKDTHHPDITTVYQMYSHRFNGLLVRDEKWWRNNVYSNNQIAVYYDEQLQAKGYLLFNVKERVMDIQEIVCLNQEARVQLWNFICQHDSMVDKVKLLLSVHENFPYFLNEPKLKIEISPYFMARVVDAEKCLEKYTFNQTNESVFIHLEDEYGDWNNGTYQIMQKGIKLFKAKEGSHCQHPPKRGLSMDINTLTAILFGYKRPIELFDMDYIKGNIEEVQELDNKIPRVNGYFYDFF